MRSVLTKVTYVVGGVNLLDEVTTDERQSLEDVGLYAGDAGCVEEGGEAEGTAKGSGLDAPR